jgi:DNA adenine methylase
MSAAAQMTYTATVPYYGSKRTLAPRIVEALGPHRCYWSLFAGSLAVELAKPPAVMETVNDLHGDVVNLARVLRDESLSGRLYWRLTRTIPGEQVFRESLYALGTGPAPGIDREPSADRAYHYFLVSWLGLNGMAGTHRVGSSFSTRYTSNGGAPAKRFVGAVESVPWWHERLRTVLILSECGIALAERIEDKAGTVIYADPPYLEKGSRYLHDFDSDDHRRLAAALCRYTRTRVVVSYYAHPDLAALYPGWRVIECPVTQGMARLPAGQVKTAPEVLLVNQFAEDAQ